MKNIDLHFFPGWVRKSMTFTIDDGNIPLDAKFISYVKPAGILGTFNLRTPLKYEKYQMTPEDYQKFYDGYEIANHCKYHAYPFTEYTTREIKDTLFNNETADKAFGYLTEEEGIYRIFTYGWTYLATDEKYMECVDKAQKELESVFGEGKIRTYVWPCGEQKNQNVFDMLKNYGFQSIRKTGCVKDTTGFAFPADRSIWSYNINNKGLCEIGALYDSYPDDGELKFFCFGLHSHDYENAGEGPGGWAELERFCQRYGNRPNDFWYASNGDLFDYEDAVKSVKVNETSIENPSDIDLYIKVDGNPQILPKHSVLSI